AEPDDERCLVAYADKPLRLVVMDDDKGEVAIEARVRAADSGGEVALIERFEQMRDNFGVGLGAERVAVGLEISLQFAVVLDDAVEHDRELAVVAAREGMCV